MNPTEKAINESLELLVNNFPELKDRTGVVRTILNILAMEIQHDELMESNKVLNKALEDLAYNARALGKEF
jgi:hypothetical protein